MEGETTRGPYAVKFIQRPAGKGAGKAVCLCHGNDDPADPDPHQAGITAVFSGYRVACIAELGEKVTTVLQLEKRDKLGAEYGPSIRCSSPPHAIASSSQEGAQEGKTFKEIDLLVCHSQNDTPASVNLTTVVMRRI